MGETALNTRKLLHLTGIFLISFLFLITGSKNDLCPYDEGLATYGATRVLNGDVPYRDFWTIYAPGQFYTLALLFKIFGTSIIVERVFTIIVQSLIALYVYLFVEKASNRRFQAILVLGGIVLLFGRCISVIYKRLAGRIGASIQIPKFLNRFLNKKELRNLAVIALCIMWLMCPLVRLSKDFLDWTSIGAGGYSTATWSDSSLMEWLLIHPLEGRVYSNSPDAIYIPTEISASMSPRKHLYNSPASTTDDLSKFARFLTSKTHVYLVWFNEEGRDYLYSVEELRSSFELEIVVICSDRVAYVVKQKRGDSMS